MDKLLEALQYNLKHSVAQSGQPLATINHVYYGDPITIPKHILPVITIMPVSTEYVNYGTEYDQKTSMIQVRLIFNRADFFNKYIGTAKTITAASYATGYVTYSVTSHGYSAGDSVTIAGMTPTAYNGVFEIYDVPTTGTFRVAFSADPGTMTAAGTSQKGTLDKIYVVEEAMQMVEQTTGKNTDTYTICGTIQNNKNMGYVNSSGTTVSATCDNITPENVSYEFNDSRGFPSFEVIVNVRATIYGDR